MPKPRGKGNELPRPKFVLDTVRGTLRAHASRLPTKIEGIERLIFGPLLEKKGEQIMAELEGREEDFVNELGHICKNPKKPWNAVPKALERLEEAYEDKDTTRFLVLAQFLRSSFAGRYGPGRKERFDSYDIGKEEWEKIRRLLDRMDPYVTPFLFIKTLSMLKTPNIMRHGEPETGTEIKEYLKKRIMEFSKEGDEKATDARIRSSVLHQLIQTVFHTGSRDDIAYDDEELVGMVKGIVRENLGEGGQPQLATVGLHHLLSSAGFKNKLQKPFPFIREVFTSPSPSVAKLALLKLRENTELFERVANELGDTIFEKMLECDEKTLKTFLWSMQKEGISVSMDPGLWKRCLGYNAKDLGNVHKTALYTLSKLPEEDFISIIREAAPSSPRKFSTFARTLGEVCKIHVKGLEFSYADKEAASKFAKAFVNLFSSGEDLNQERIRKFPEAAIGAWGILASYPTSSGQQVLISKKVDEKLSRLALEARKEIKKKENPH